ncbi:MAG: hypothetical protein IKF79_02315 [Methanosphaera sp.]|nr:hypothetical protein [Methanosphaera sp.]
MTYFYHIIIFFINRLYRNDENDNFPFDEKTFNIEIQRGNEMSEDELY